MAEVLVMSLGELAQGQKKVVRAGEVDVLLIHMESGLVAVQAKCPHAGAPLEQGAVCDGRLVCPWHMGTFALPSGTLVEPPPMEPLKTYAVRVQGEQIFVDTEPLPKPALAQQTSEKPVFLLVGAGAAGAMAATTLRQEGFAGRIVAVDPVGAEPVDRTQLSKQALSGKMPLAKIAIPTFATVQAERVDSAVIELRGEAGEALLSDGRVIRFDRALVATGGTPKRLAVPGEELAYAIRHPADVEAILEATAGKSEVAVIGTSFIALEAASALIERGLQVTVIGREDLPFAEKFGEEVARSIKALHESKGTRFRLGVEIVEIEAAGVTVMDKGAREKIAAEVVILGVGVSPELGFKHDLPLAAKGGGVGADTSLRARGAVWVAGDIANVEGTRIEHWRLAQQHGRTAAFAMLGREATYDGVPFFWTFHFGKRLGYLGHAEEWDEIVIDGDVAGLDFLAYYRKGDVVAAILSCGRDSETARLAEVMRGRPTLEQVRQSL